jgi:hypothetical protein
VEDVQSLDWFLAPRTQGTVDEVEEQLEMIELEMGFPGKAKPKRNPLV